MPNLTPSSGNKRRATSDAPLTRVVVVRENQERASKNVRLNEDATQLGVRTGFWTALGFATIAFIWLTGHIGESHGFAESIGIVDLACSRDFGLAAGVRLLLNVPLRIFEMAMVEPFRLVIAFAAIALPAAGLAVARPRVPGGPPLHKLVQGFSILGLIAASITFALLITWTAWPTRRATLGQAPMDREAFGAWLDASTVVAGFDAMAFVAGTLWLVLLFRMPLPRVAVAFAATGGFISLFVAWTGFATSNGIIDGCRIERPVIVTLTGDEATDPRSLLLGTLHGKTTVMGSGAEPLPLVLPATEFIVSERASLAAWMRPLPAQ